MHVDGRMMSEHYVLYRGARTIYLSHSYCFVGFLSLPISGLALTVRTGTSADAGSELINRHNTD